MKAYVRMLYVIIGLGVLCGQVARAQSRTFVDTKRWTCLVDARGDVYCNMRNYQDFWPAPALSSASAHFEQVSGLAQVRALDALGEYVCALDQQGGVQCWGCLYSLCRLWPKPIALSGPAQQIAVESVGACALLQSGAVQCWGSAWNGSFGGGESLARVTEEPATVPLSGKIVQLSATTDARCALSDRGEVTCWGDVCGNGDPLGFKPRRMKLERVTAIAANVSFTCAVAGAQREVSCWGYPDFAQTSTPTTGGSPRARCAIRQIRNLKHVKQLALGYLSGAALTDEGAVYVWGQAHFGAPQPTAAKRFDREPARVATGLGVKRVLSSGNYACLELEAGELRCDPALAHAEDVWPTARFDSDGGAVR